MQAYESTCYCLYLFVHVLLVHLIYYGRKIRVKPGSMVGTDTISKLWFFSYMIYDVNLIYLMYRIWQWLVDTCRVGCMTLS